jgi:hypothetical protein
MATSSPLFSEPSVSLLLSYWRYNSLGVVLELGIAELLADVSLSVDEFAEKSSTHSARKVIPI